jgi:hypothetical protein
LSSTMPQLPGRYGEGGQKVELARTWRRIERLHARRFGKATLIR